ncbi:unnamed protein product [Cochlearia groenlandica]
MVMNLHRFSFLSSSSLDSSFDCMDRAWISSDSRCKSHIHRSFVSASFRFICFTIDSDSRRSSPNHHHRAPIDSNRAINPLDLASKSSVLGLILRFEFFSFVSEIVFPRFLRFGLLGAIHHLNRLRSSELDSGCVPPVYQQSLDVTPRSFCVRASLFFQFPVRLMLLYVLLEIKSISTVKRRFNPKHRTLTPDSPKISSPKDRYAPYGSSSLRIAFDFSDRSDLRGFTPVSPVITSSKIRNEPHHSLFSCVASDVLDCADFLPISSIYLSRVSDFSDQSVLRDVTLDSLCELMLLSSSLLISQESVSTCSWHNFTALVHFWIKHSLCPGFGFVEFIAPHEIILIDDKLFEEILWAYLKLELMLMSGFVPWPLYHHPRARFWFHCHDLKEFNILLQSSQRLYYFTYLIIMWNQALLCSSQGCVYEVCRRWLVYYTRVLSSRYVIAQGELWSNRTKIIMLVLMEACHMHMESP